MSEYVCVASNGIPPDESWTVKLLVTFSPLVQAQSEVVQASVGSMARMVCTTEAWPRPEMGWEKDGEPIYESNNVAMTHTVSGQYHSVHILEIRNVQQSHFGVYRCVAKNDNGIHHSQVTLQRSQEDVPSSPPELEFYSQARRHESRNAPTTHSGMKKRHLFLCGFFSIIGNQKSRNQLEFINPFTRISESNRGKVGQLH
ncbi:CBN-RIG-5 protein [Caenorhabditis brenneri]|uniref:CBN-RIG-5 protein n=1 Tax=Caenorhabditis brenneri TaxID=135651 RepID=G0MF08_CAEBE|nr:CBN-RIG-5 protein [Caenorhabditis brenneri]